MSGHDRTGRSKSDGKHVRDYEWMLASPAYRSLDCYARCLLTELKRLYSGSNNGQLFLGVRRAADLLGVHKDTAGKAFQALQQRGFIRAHIKSGFQWKRGQATTWILEEFEFAGHLPTKSFMRWKPGQEKNTVLPDRTECPSKPDTRPKKPDTSEGERPTGPDTFAQNEGDHGPKKPDTVNQPSGGPSPGHSEQPASRRPTSAAQPPTPSKPSQIRRRRPIAAAVTRDQSSR